MPAEPASYLASAWMQCGFAAFAMTLLGVVCWQFRQLHTTYKEKNHVVEANTTATRSLVRVSEDQTRVLRNIHHELLQRPCMAKLKPPDS